MTKSEFCLPSETNVSEDALRLHDETIVWDMTLAWSEGFGDDSTLDRFRASGIGLVSLTAMAMKCQIGPSMTYLNKVRSAIEAHPNYILVKSVGDILRAHTEGKMAVTLNFQDTRAFEDSLDNIAAFYELGVRHAGLTYNIRNLVGDGCFERHDGGLSHYGIKVVEEMNRVGMLVDGSHCSYRTSMEAMEISSAPVIFSHANAAAVYDHPRNLKDDQIKACADNGGVIGVNGAGFYLQDSLHPVDAFFEQIDYMVSMVGSEHVGIGLDYVADLGVFWDFMADEPHLWPGSLDNIRENAIFLKPEELILITDKMVSHGYPHEDIRNILGRNFFRVAEQVWR